MGARDDTARQQGPACRVLEAAPVARADDSVAWRQDVQAVAFTPAGHGALCMVHRLALRTLAGRMLSADDCVAFASASLPAFEAAARAKIAARGLPSDRALHLTSRDIRRAGGVRAVENHGSGTLEGRRE